VQQVEVAGDELRRWDDDQRFGCTLTQTIENIPVNGRELYETDILTPGVAGSPTRSGFAGVVRDFSMNGRAGRSKKTIALLDGDMTMAPP